MSSPNRGPKPHNALATSYPRQMPIAENIRARQRSDQHYPHFISSALTLVSPLLPHSCHAKTLYSIAPEIKTVFQGMIINSRTWGPLGVAHMRPRTFTYGTLVIVPATSTVFGRDPFRTRSAIRVAVDCHYTQDRTQRDRRWLRRGVGSPPECASIVAVQSQQVDHRSLPRDHAAVGRRRPTAPWVTLLYRSLTERNRRKFLLADSPVPDFVRAGVDRNAYPFADTSGIGNCQFLARCR